MRKIKFYDFAAVAVILAGVIIIFLPLLLKQEAFLSGDLGECTRPLLDYARSAKEEWNPYVLLGRQGITDGTIYPRYYPAYFLYNLFSGPRIFYLIYIIHIFWCALGMFLWLKAQKKTALSAYTGAIIFAGSGFISARIYAGQLPHVLSVSWLPWVFFTASFMFKRRSAKSAFLCGLALAFQIWAGFPQFAVITVFGIIFYYIVFSPRFWKSRLREKIYSIQLLLILIAVGYMLTLPSTAPVMTMMERSQRASGLTLEQAMVDSVAPSSLTRLWFPWSGYDYPNMPMRTDFWETAAFAGIVVWLLYAAALALGGFKRRVSGALPEMLLGITALLLALGGYFPLYPFLSENVPAFLFARVPARFLALFTLALALLAARAMAWIQSVVPRRFYRLLYAVPVFICIELSIFSWQLLFTPFPGMNGVPYWSESRPPVIDFLKRTPRPFRIVTLSDFPMLNESLDHRVENCGGYLGLVPERLLRIVRAVDPGNNHEIPLYFKRPGVNFFRLLNVRYVITRSDYPPEGMALKPVFRDGAVKVYASPDPFPRAWLVPRFIETADELEYIFLLGSASFNPYSEAFGPSGAIPGGPYNYEVEVEPVEVTEYADGRARFHAKVPAPMALVISELFDTNWRAAVNGRPLNTFPVYGALLGVFLPEGEHTVDVVYKDSESAFRISAGFLAGALFLMAAFLTLKINKKDKTG